MHDSESTQVQLHRLQQDILACRRCHAAGLLERANPISFGGAVEQRVMVIGQAPGPVTDRKGYHFAGPAGRVLEQWLSRAGFPDGYFRSGCYLTSLTRCFPGKAADSNGDRRPSSAELQLCRPFLDAEITLVDPAVVLLVGQMAIEALIGKHSLRDVVGRVLERDGRHYLPLPHSSGVSRWLNAPENRSLVDLAIDHLARLRRELSLGGP